MPDATLSDVLEEAYAAAPADQILIDMLSIYYEGMVNDSNVPDELYIYGGGLLDTRSAEGVPLKQFKIENTADINAGQTITAVNLPFEIVLPDVVSDALSKGKLAIDGVGREISRELQAAIELGVAIRVTYRPYLEGLELDGPQQDPTIKFYLSNVTISGWRASGDIIVPIHGNRRFPGEVYTVGRFPNLGT